MRAGELPLALVEILTGECADLQDRQQPREKLLAAMSLLRASRIPLVSANGSTRSLTVLPEACDEYAEMASAVCAGKASTVASLTWSLILHVDVGCGPESKGALAELLTWARDATSGYSGVAIGRTRYAWSEAFADGMVWCALLDAHDDQLINLSEVSQLGGEERRKVLFAVAEAALDIPVFCDAALPVDDPRVAITFTAQLRNALHARQVLAEQARLEAARAEAEARQTVEQQAVQRREVEAQQRPRAQEQAARLEARRRHAAAEATLADDASAAGAAAADAAEAIDSFDRVASHLASGAGHLASVAVGMADGQRTADDTAAATKSFSRHSVAWQLRRRRELSLRQGAGRKGPTASPRAESAFPYPLPRVSSTAPATPRLAV